MLWEGEPLAFRGAGASGTLPELSGTTGGVRTVASACKAVSSSSVCFAQKSFVEERGQKLFEQTVQTLRYVQSNGNIGTVFLNLAPFFCCDSDSTEINKHSEVLEIRFFLQQFIIGFP
ncbi:hypothetical protein Tco_1227565 [Tanacetum coccineum]